MIKSNIKTDFNIEFITNISSWFVIFKLLYLKLVLYDKKSKIFVFYIKYEY